MADFVFTELDLAYAAGIVDGEGYIGITEYRPVYEPGNRAKRRKGPSFRCQIAVAMVDPVAPMMLAQMFGGTVHTYPGRKVNHRTTHTWRLQNRRAADACGLLLPYLRVKHRQAQLLVDFYADERFSFVQRKAVPDEEVAQRREYVTAVRALNGRG